MASTDPDRVAAMGHLVVDAFGTLVRIDAEDEAVDRLRHQWSRALRDDVDGEAADVHVTHRNADPLAGDYAVTSAVTLAAIKEQSGNSLMLHSGGLATEDGRVLALVASSGTGKTTASMALCKRGFGYVSDETITVNDLVVSPYCKPLSHIIDPAKPREKEQLCPDDLGLGTPPAGELRLDGFVLLTRDPERTEPPALDPVPLVRAVVELTEQTSALPRMPQPLARFAEVVQRVGAHRLTYREIDECAGLLHDLAATPQAQRPARDDVEHLPPGDHLRQDADASTTAARVGPTPDLDRESTVHRLPYTDAIASGTQIAVLRSARVTLVDGVGALVWEVAERPTSVTALVDECVRTFGEHPEAEDLVRAAVTELADAGLVGVD